LDERNGLGGLAWQAVSAINRLFRRWW